MKMKSVLLFIWQLPQNIIGFVLSRFAVFDGEVYRVDANIAVALGQYIIVNTHSSAVTIRHEQGHVKQSRMLGPLYLIIVGVPSITMNILTRLGLLDHRNYYNRFPENWADRLGGVER